MRMLDIDMDFFQTGIHCWGNDKDSFLTDDNISVWTDDEIIDFLENKCCLDKNNKIKGRIVKHHVEAYSFWNELVCKDTNIVPFEVTHIDAHSDLWFSMDIPFYRFINSLNSDEQKKQMREGTIFKDKESLIDSGNYLLAAVIIGWVDNIKYIYHPDLDCLDVFESIVENIKPYKLFKFNFCDYIKEKDIYLEIVSKKEYCCTEKYDYAAIALSPPYVKKEMEDKLNIIKEYIDII